MSLGTYNKCCGFVDLRLGSFIIGYLLLISRSIQLILGCIHLSGLNIRLAGHMNHNFMYVDLGFFKLILSLELLLLTFELLITVALLNGLHRKIQDQVQMFYVGGFVFEVLRLIIMAVILLRYGHLMVKMYDAWHWATLTLELIGHLFYLYCLTAIRSYYFEMIKDDTAQLWNVFANSEVQLKVNK